MKATHDFGTRLYFYQKNKSKNCMELYTRSSKQSVHQVNIERSNSFRHYFQEL